MSDDDLDQLNRISSAPPSPVDSAINATNRIFSRQVVTTPQEDADIAAAMDAADARNRSAFAPPVVSTTATVPATPAATPAGIDIDAVNSRIGALSGALKTRRDPDAYSRYIDPKREAEINHELTTLTNVANEHARDTNLQLRQSLQAQRERDVLTQTNNALAGLAQIPMDGSPEAAAAMLKLKQDNLLAWTHSPGLRKEFETHAKTHDAIAAQTQQGATEYYSPEALLKENPGAEYRQNPKTGGFIVSIGNPKKPGAPDDGFAALDDHLQKNYGITSDDLDKVDLSAPETVKLFSRSGKPVTAKQAAELGDEAHATIYGVGSKGYTEIPYKQWQKLSQTYQNLGGSYDDTATAAATPTPAPVPTPPPAGFVKGGYRFKGGDPSKQENWEKQ